MNDAKNIKFLPGALTSGLKSTALAQNIQVISDTTRRDFFCKYVNNLLDNIVGTNLFDFYSRKSLMRSLFHCLQCFLFIS